MTNDEKRIEILAWLIIILMIVGSMSVAYAYSNTPFSTNEYNEQRVCIA